RRRARANLRRRHRRPPQARGAARLHRPAPRSGERRRLRDDPTHRAAIVSDRNISNENIRLPAPMPLLVTDLVADLVPLMPQLAPHLMALSTQLIALGVKVPVVARGQAHHGARDAVRRRQYPAAAMVASAPPGAGRAAMPVVAGREEDLLIGILHHL